MPFVDGSAAVNARGSTAGALAHDVITRLAKLRSLFVIAQGTVFALHERRITAEGAGRMLNVDYVASGSVQREGKRLTVTVELTEARTARIVWTDVFNHPADDTFTVLDEIGNQIVSSIATEIETAERNHAILRPPNSLDAWGDITADHLSPFDPLLFGMLGARAMALVRLGQFEEAANWGIKAATRPNAHAHILAIAALSLALAGRLDEARRHCVDS